MQPIDLSVLDQYPISSWSYPRVLLGIPLERAVSYAEKVFYNFMYIAAQGPAFVENKYGRIDLIRNNMVMQLLSTDFTHLLMLDVDHIHPTDIIQRLARWVLIYPEVRVVSGLNFRRKKPFDPVAGRYVNGNGKRAALAEWDQGLLQVDEVGAASLLVDKRVFLQMEPPWFFNIYDNVWKNDLPGEDIGFSRKCNELGIPIYVDTTTSSPHCTEALVTEQTFREYMRTHPDEYHEA